MLVASATVGDGTPGVEIGGKLCTIRDTSDAGEAVAECACTVLYGGELTGAGLRRMKSEGVFEQVDDAVLIGIEVVGSVATVRGCVEVLHTPYFDRGEWTVDLQLIDADGEDVGKGFESDAGGVNGGKGEKMTQCRAGDILGVVDRGDGLPCMVGCAGIGIGSGGELQSVGARGACQLLAGVVTSEGDAMDRHGCGSEVDADEAVEAVCDPTAGVAVNAIVHAGDAVWGYRDDIFGESCFSDGEIVWRKGSTEFEHLRHIAHVDGKCRGGAVVRGIGSSDGHDSFTKRKCAAAGV